MITDGDIQNLIRVPKRIVVKSPTRGYREENGSRRCDLDLQPADGPGRSFPVFIRQHLRFGRNFSIGLRYTVNEGKLTTVTLARYNGPHGEASRDPDGHHAVSHIHYITEVEIAAGHTLPQDNHRELTNKYNTFEEALRAFFADTSTQNYSDFFPELMEPRLFNGY